MAWVIPICALLLVASCGSSAEPKPIHDVAGTWAGKTAQREFGADNPISFTVETNEVTTISISVDVNTQACVSSGNFVIGRGTGPPIAMVQQNQFEIIRQLQGGAYAMNMTGEFSSPTTASGALAFTDVACNVTVQTTWTATKAE